MDRFRWREPLCYTFCAELMAAGKFDQFQGPKAMWRVSPSAPTSAKFGEESDLIKSKTSSAIVMMLKGRIGWKVTGVV